MRATRSKHDCIYVHNNAFNLIKEMIEGKKILECIAHGMSCNGSYDIQSESMKCLYEIIELIRENILIEKERRIIYQMVLN